MSLVYNPLRILGLDRISTNPLYSSITLDTDLATQPLDLVVVNGTNSVIKISDNTTATMPSGIFGIGLSKPTTTTIEVVTFGLIQGFSGLVPGQPVFVSLLGVLIQTPPATGMVQHIGLALSSTDLYLNLMQPMRRST